jgi:hypothetical protein
VDVPEAKLSIDLRGLIEDIAYRPNDRLRRPEVGERLYLNMTRGQLFESF